MKISYNWLREKSQLKQTAEEIAARLTAVGLPVEGIEPLAPPLSGVVVSEIREIKPHPNADRLSLVQVDDGRGMHSIVCGAPNISVGDKVPFAPVDTVLPEMTIKAAKIRGIESQGMLCSAAELGLPLVQEEGGLLQLPQDLPPGQLLGEALGLDDVILDIELTANRGDCLSLRGLAVEAAAAFGNKVTPVLPGEVEGEADPFPLAIKTDACLRYTGRIIRNVRVQPSPLWLQLRLLACGIRPVNNIVDCTNLVMLELGQPLHAFDLHKLPAEEIAVRQAMDGEEIKTLDGKIRSLDPGMMLITSGGKPVAVAGVMGSLDSEVDEKTADILLESALFDGGSVRRTAKALGIASDAAARYEKGVDPAVVAPASHRAAALIADLAGGRIGEIVDVGSAHCRQWTVAVDLERVNRLLGTEIPGKTAVEILERLGLEVSGQEKLTVRVDGRRNDLENEEDIAEELARSYGYEHIPATLPRGETTQGVRTQEQNQVWHVREALLGCGLQEVIPLAFTGPEWVGRAKASQGVALTNPLTVERSQMRGDMLPSFLELAMYNRAHGRQGLAIFEIGSTYRLDRSKPIQQWRVAGLLAGSRPLHWEERGSYDFYDCKGVVEQLASSLGIAAWFDRGRDSRFHPGRCAVLHAGEAKLGLLGQLHPVLCREAKLEGDIYWFDLDLAALLDAAAGEVEFRAPYRFPAVNRDLAVEMADKVEADTVRRLIKEAGGDWLESVNCFDVYQGETLGAGRKSLAFALSFRHHSRTLKDKEVNKQMGKIVHLLAQHDIQLRE